MTYAKALICQQITTYCIPKASNKTSSNLPIGLNLFFSDAFEALKDKTFTDMRLVTTDGNIDFAITEKKQDMISRLYSLFDKEMKK